MVEEPKFLALDEISVEEPELVAWQPFAKDGD
jgi:hypothetical protein